MDKFINYALVIEKIVLACFVPEGKGMMTHKNRPSHGLALHTSGVKKYEFSSGKTLIVSPGDIIYLPKYSFYKVSAIEDGDCYAINFDIQEDITFDPFVISTKNTQEFIEYFKTATKAWDSKKQGYVYKCKAQLYNILSSISKEHFSGYLPKSKLLIIEKAVDYIHKNYTKELLSIEKLSKMCDITPEYFRSIFRKNFGTSPLSYINNLKISHAKELIESGMYSVSAAAILSGYTDISHFSREFKKHIGIPPSEYMKNVQP